MSEFTVSTPLDSASSPDADIFAPSPSISLPPTPEPVSKLDLKTKLPLPYDKWKPQWDYFKETFLAAYKFCQHQQQLGEDKEESACQQPKHRRSFSEPPHWTDLARLKLLVANESRKKMMSSEYRRQKIRVSRRMSSLPEAKKNSRFLSYGEAVGFWKNRIRRIMHLLRWFAELKKSEVLREHVKQITDLLQKHEKEAQEQERQRNTFFDRSLFASRRDVVISKENAMILTLKGASRTPDQIKQVVNNLSWAISSFAEYPVGMQYGLAGVAMYQRINPQRVIIRQGHYPENFYFIISGVAQVIVCKQVGGDYEQKSVARIGKGQCFGEIALIHQTTRQATVESASEMELLVITKYDFFKIFLAKPDPSKGEEPEYVKLMRTLTFLHEWPIEKIDETPGACILHFFRSGTVVVSDSNTSNWIYIVKAGSCVVMKKLKQVIAQRKRNIAANIDTASAESMFGSRKIFPRIDNGRRRPMEKPPVTDLINDESIFGDMEEEHIAYLMKMEQELREPQDGYTDEKETEEKMRQRAIDPSKQTVETQTAKRQKLYEAFFAGAPKPVASSENKARRSLFVQMGLLRERDVFGLEDIQFDDDIPTSHTSVCLVSRGAELIMFSKDLFLRHVTAQGKETLRKIVKPYPDEAILQHNLQVEMDWRLYREAILKEELGAKKLHKTDVSFRPEDLGSLTNMRKWQ